MGKTFEVKLAMVHRAALQEHPGEWDEQERPEWGVGDSLVFTCHGETVASGVVTAVLEPREPGSPNWTGTKRDNWWRTLYGPSGDT